MPPSSSTTRANRASSSPLLAILILAPIYALVAFVTLRQYHSVPTPQVSPTSSDGRAQLSEAVILDHVKFLSEDIGFRSVGTVEHAKADEWVWEMAQTFQKECEEIVRKSDRKLECEIWHQRGSGSHRFDIMATRLYKTYTNLTNIIVRLSDGTDAGKEHALLINSHIDSPISSPGAADDALAVSVMLDCMRVLLDDETWSPSNAVVFLFNNAEETLQDASQLFCTQHDIASTIRGAVNLEAAGTTGPEILFQVTSEEMLQAYAKVPYPFGTVIATDIFGTGVMLSDTDFRQFALYLNVSGLDMALSGNSYLYHMRKDLVENIQVGVPQHMAENVLSLIRTLTASTSPLPGMKHGYTQLKSVFFSYLGFFVLYSSEVGMAAYTILTGVILVGASRIPDPAPALAGSSAGRRFVELSRGVLLSTGSFLGAIVGVNVLAAFMNTIGKSHSWFSRYWLPVPLYTPPALIGCLLARVILPDVGERAVWASTSLVMTVVGTAMHASGLRSGVVFVISGVPMALPLFTPARSPNLKLWYYIVGALGALMTGVQVMSTVMDVFVPLTGRIGSVPPAEHIVATLVAILGAYTLPLLPALAVRYPKKSALRGAMVLTLVTAMGAGYFATRNPFDVLHQRRLFILHMHNETTGLEHLHVAAADSAPGFGNLVVEMNREFATPGLASIEMVEMNDWNADWDMIYPFSQFLSPWSLELPASAVQPEDKIVVEAVDDVLDTMTGTRSLTLKITLHDVVWPAIAFDAQVLSWTLDDSPPPEHARHHVKSALFLGSDTYSLGLVINATSFSSLAVSHVGMRRRAMWPAQKNSASRDPATNVLARVDAWMDEKYEGVIDATMIGAVGGVTVV